MQLVFLKLKPWIAGGALILWASIGLLFWWNPNFENEGLVWALAILAVLGIFLAPLLLVLVYHQQLVRWPVLGGALVAVALVHAEPLFFKAAVWPQLIPFLQFSSYTSLWVILTGLAIKRDAGLKMLLIAVGVLAWLNARLAFQLGGSEALVLYLLSPVNNGQLWGMNTVLVSLFCLGPLVPFTFGGWLFWRVIREFLNTNPL